MSRRFHRFLLALAVVPALVVPPAGAADQVVFELGDTPAELATALRAAALSVAAGRDTPDDAQARFGAAQADYGRLLGALYAAGHYSGTISIRIDGREAAAIAPLNAPAQVGTVTITVNPGPPFVFDRAEVAPLAPGTTLPTDFAPGAPARSGTIRDAAAAAVTGWRDQGHAKAQIGAQSLIADHPRQVIAARLQVAPGPLVHLGELRFAGQDKMRLARLHKIAGLRPGTVYSPAELRRAAERLRRTGVFRSVVLTEAENLGPGNTLDLTATVTEMPRHRIGFGAELTSADGATLSAFWLHRNLLGGAERLRIRGEARQIGAGAGGTDWLLGLDLDRPATLTPDTTAHLGLELARENDRFSRTDRAEFGLGFSHVFSDRLTGSAALRYRRSRTTDATGQRDFRQLALPLGLTWDRRDNAADPRHGSWITAEIMPFAGFSGTGSGLRATFDARAYRALGERVVLAGRVQGGLISGADIEDVPRDYLFWSGGGGTVRGQPFRSLGVARGATRMDIGGTRFVGASVELRGKVTEKIGAVAFVDYGRIGDRRYGNAPASDWHAGAGLGVRYATPVGPIRLDIAAPAGGKKGKGMQLYLGIGQAF